VRKGAGRARGESSLGGTLSMRDTRVAPEPHGSPAALCYLCVTYKPSSGLNIHHMYMILLEMYPLFFSEDLRRYHFTGLSTTTSQWRPSMAKVQGRCQGNCDDTARVTAIE
jgi:hypothetical protein